VDDAEFERLSATILDGEAPDWDALERATPPERRGRLDALRVVAQVAARSRDALGPRQTERWAGFDLLDPVGHGGYGEVWRARDPQLDREIALKLIPAGDEDVEDVLREGRLLARIRHPNVAAVYGASYVDGEIGVAMEFVGGDDLDTAVRRDGPLRVRDVTDVGLQLARALEAVHRAGVLHRDIKASNVKRSEDGRVILLDFGSSRELRLHTTEPSDEAGTPLYVAPEVLAGAAASVQSDLYSLGVLLHFIATGRYPVTASSFDDLAAKHAIRRTSGKALDEAARLPRNLGVMLNALLAPDPGARPRSAADVARRLARRWPRYALTAAVAVFVVGAGGAFSARFLTRTSGFGSDASSIQRRLEFAIAPATIGRPSRDGRVLPFVDRRNGGLALMRVESGAIELLTPSADMRDNFAGASAASPDGGAIAYQWHGDRVSRDELRILDVDRRTSRVVWRADADDSEVAPTSWSPDGTHIAGVITHGERQDVFVLPAEGGRPTIYATGGADAPTFSDDGRFLVFGHPGEHGSALWKVELPSGTPAPVGIAAVDDGSPLWSRNRLLFISNRDGASAVWSVLVNADGDPVGAPSAVPGTTGTSQLLGLTAEGSLLSRREEGTSQILVANIDGSGQREISSGPGRHLSPDWSPDGREVAYITEPPGPFVHVLRIRDLASGDDRSFKELARSIGHPGRIGMNPRFSPDGDRVLLRAIDRGTDTGFIVVNLTTLAESSPYLPARHYMDVEWEAGNRVIFGEVGRGISRLNLDTHEEELLFRVPRGMALGRGVALTPDRSRIAFVLVTPGAGTSHIMVMNRDGSDPHELFAKSRPRPYGGLPFFAAVPLLLGQWTADGRNLLFASTEVLPSGYTKWETALWALPAEGGAPHATGLVIPGLRDIRVNPNDGQLAFTTFTVHMEAVVLPGVLRQTEQMR